MAPPSLSGSGGPTTKEDCEHVASQLLDNAHGKLEGPYRCSNDLELMFG